jgi:hypothetical protein
MIIKRQGIHLLGESLVSLMEEDGGLAFEMIFGNKNYGET